MCDQDARIKMDEKENIKYRRARYKKNMKNKKKILRHQEIVEKSINIVKYQNVACSGSCSKSHL